MPPASYSKTPLSEPNSSIHATSLLTETTALAVAVLDCGTKKRETEHTASGKWPQRTDFKSWKISLKARPHSSQYPRDAVQWIDDVEDAKGVDDLFISASPSRKPMMEFENLDFKVASGLRTNRARNFMKQINTAEGKAQSEKRSLMGR